jgi:gluconate 2-dehydrogenase gamma chain
LRRRSILALAGAAVACRSTRSTSQWRFFTEDQARTVEAITAQLIPTGPGPGAREAGVVHYIDLQLSRRFRKHQKAYRDGLANVDFLSHKTHNQPFVDLTSDQQIEILNSLEEHAKPFFQLILAHTRQGFYGDPRHGGNRDRVSWKLLGLPYPPLRGRESYSTPKAG